MLGGDEDRTWRDEMTLDAVHAFLRQAISAAAREEIDLPHLVVCHDPDTGVSSYSGPYLDGLTALNAAERERVLDEATNDGTPLVFTVATLHPAGSSEPAGHDG